VPSYQLSATFSLLILLHVSTSSLVSRVACALVLLVGKQCILLTTGEAAWYIISVLSPFVCLTITFESLDIGSSYLHIRCISKEYGSRSYIKVIGSRSRSQDRSKNGRKSLFPQCKTSIGHNSGSTKHKGMRFACSTRSSADRTV